RAIRVTSCDVINPGRGAGGDCACARLAAAASSSKDNAAAPITLTRTESPIRTAHRYSRAVTSLLAIGAPLWRTQDFLHKAAKRATSSSRVANEVTSRTRT